MRDDDPVTVVVASDSDPDADVVASATEDKTDTTLDRVVGGDSANEENLPTANAGETDTARPWSFWWLGPLRRWL